MRTEYDFSKGKRGAVIPQKGKTRISIFIDNAILAEFRARAEKAGRDPAAVTVSIFGVPPDADKLAGLRDAGVTRVVFFVPSAIADTVLPLLDGYAAVAKKVG